MPRSPEEVKKYNDMLDTLIEDYPELEEEASALGSAIADIDIGDDEGEEDIMIAPDMEEGLEDEEDIMMLDEDEDEDDEDILL